MAKLKDHALLAAKHQPQGTGFDKELDASNLEALQRISITSCKATKSLSWSEDQALDFYPQEVFIALSETVCCRLV